MSDTISDALQQLKIDEANIRNILIEKGVPATPGTGFGDFAELIDEYLTLRT